VLVNNLSDDLLDREDLDILDPEFSTFSGTTPLLLGGTDLAAEIRGSLALCREKLEANENAKICIAVCGFSLLELSYYGKLLGLPVLDGTASLDEGSIFLSDLAQTKGFEFDLVCIVNCSLGILPDRAAPDEEQFRDLAKLYVAMTRAKVDLVLSWSGAPSPLLSGAESRFLVSNWHDYVPEIDSLERVPIPERIDLYREEKSKMTWRTLTGQEFLFTEAAVGVSTDLSSKIRLLVDGRGLRKKNQSIKWATLGAAADAYRTNPPSRLLWGPEVGRQFAELMERLEENSRVDTSLQLPR
jgi:hypothetical protein